MGEAGEAGEEIGSRGQGTGNREQVIPDDSIQNPKSKIQNHLRVDEFALSLLKGGWDVIFLWIP